MFLCPRRVDEKGRTPTRGPEDKNIWTRGITDLGKKIQKGNRPREGLVFCVNPKDRLGGLHTKGGGGGGVLGRGSGCLKREPPEPGFKPHNQPTVVMPKEPLLRAQLLKKGKEDRPRNKKSGNPLSKKRVHEVSKNTLG